MPHTSNQNDDFKTYLKSAVIALVVIGGLMSIGIYGGRGTGILLTLFGLLIFLFYFIHIVRQAVKNTRKTVQGGGSSTTDQPPGNIPETDAAPVTDEEEHDRVIGEILGRRKMEIKTDPMPVKPAAETDTADAIRERDWRLPTDEPPPGYARCVSCGNLARLTGKRTRCPVCGSIIEVK
jgi:hypothetical protein